MYWGKDKMPCPDSIKERKEFEEDRVLSIFKRDEILELVKLRRENPEEYKRTLKEVAEVLRDINKVIREVNK